MRLTKPCGNRPQGLERLAGRQVRPESPSSKQGRRVRQHVDPGLKTLVKKVDPADLQKLASISDKKREHRKALQDLDNQEQEINARVPHECVRAQQVLDKKVLEIENKEKNLEAERQRHEREKAELLTDVSPSPTYDPDRGGP